MVTAPYAGRAACDTRGWCGLGCPHASLSTADVSYWPLALKNGVELRTNARVREIVLAPDGRARGALYYDESGVIRQLQAAVVVVACGGLGTPRLVMMSASSRPTDAVANSSGLMGKQLMTHVHSFDVSMFA